MIQKISSCVLLAAMAGCAGRSDWPLPAGHAGRSDAPTAPYNAGPDVLQSLDRSIDSPLHDDPTQPRSPDEGDHSIAVVHSDQASTGNGSAYPLETCVVTGAPLGSMGEPVVYVHEGLEVRFCCAGCVSTFEADPEKYLPKLRHAMDTADHVHDGGEE